MLGAPLQRLLFHLQAVCCVPRGLQPLAHSTAQPTFLSPALCSFVARYGVLFETTRGPPMKFRPGTWEFDPATGRYDRGAMVPLTAAESRAARAWEVARVS